MQLSSTDNSPVYRHICYYFNSLYPSSPAAVQHLPSIYFYKLQIQ